MKYTKIDSKAINKSLTNVRESEEIAEINKAIQELRQNITAETATLEHLKQIVGDPYVYNSGGKELTAFTRYQGIKIMSFFYPDYSITIEEIQQNENSFLASVLVKANNRQIQQIGTGKSVFHAISRAEQRAYSYFFIGSWFEFWKDDSTNGL